MQCFEISVVHDNYNFGRLSFSVFFCEFKTNQNITFEPSFKTEQYLPFIKLPIFVQNFLKLRILTSVYLIKIKW